ncbi:hypothetical protein AAHE18_04G231800 [Arachis hypogaea]
MEVELDGLCDFHNLETLHVLYTSSKDLRIGGLKQLRHLHCEFLVKLIDEQVKDKMQNLQTLCYVIADSKLGSLLGNAYFPNLRTLGLYITAYQDRQATEAEEILKSLHCLRKLRKVKLTFAPFGWVPLDRIAFPSTLTKITLSSFGGFMSKDMIVLGQIRSLQILKLKSGICTEIPLHCGTAGSFPELQVLIMIRMSVKRLTSEEGAMPRLRRAVFCDCPYLLEEEVTQKMLSLGSNLEFLDRQVDDDD